MTIPLEFDADVNAQSSGGDTPLMKAIMFDNVDAVKFLLQNGADQLLQNYDQRDALCFAKATNNPEILDILEAC